MELTTVQKIKVLDYAIEEIEGGRSDYMCTAIRWGLIDEGFRFADIHNACEIFPHLLKFKPWFKGRELSWFKPTKRDKRIRILKKVKHKLFIGC